MKTILLLLLMLSVSFATNLTVESWSIGYGEHEIVGTVLTTTDYLGIGACIGLAIMVMLFAYLHTNSNGFMWSNLWFFLMCFIVIGDLIAIYMFSDAEGSSYIRDVALGLFVGFIWMFILSLWVFLLMMLKNFIDGMKKSMRI